MAKYRKKPVEIEAFKWTGDINQTEDPIWIVEAIQKDDVWFSGDSKNGYTVMKIANNGSVIAANRGDYIIKGVNGVICPCKPEIFEMVYEAAEEIKEVNQNPYLASLIFEAPYEDGWKSRCAVKEINDGKIILFNGKEIEFENLRVKLIQGSKVIFYSKDDINMLENNEKLNIIIIKCDGEEIILNTKLTVVEIAEEICCQKEIGSSFVSVEDCLNGFNVLFNPQKVSSIKYFNK